MAAAGSVLVMGWREAGGLPPPLPGIGWQSPQPDLPVWKVSWWRQHKGEEPLTLRRSVRKVPTHLRLDWSAGASAPVDHAGALTILLGTHPALSSFNSCFQGASAARPTAPTLFETLSPLGRGCCPRFLPASPHRLHLAQLYTIHTVIHRIRSCLAALPCYHPAVCSAQSTCAVTQLPLFSLHPLAAWSRPYSTDHAPTARHSPTHRPH